MKIGIIGWGDKGRQHIQAIQRQKNARITALADPVVERKNLAGLIPDDVTIYGSADALLYNASIDVVHIITPPSTHAEIACLALSSGAHVYIEKPFTLHAADAEKIFSLAEERGLSVCAGHQVLFEKPAINAMQYLNKIGKLIHVESYCSVETIRRNISPVDELIDILPQPVCLLLNFLEYASGVPAKTEAICISPKGEVRVILRASETYGTLNVSLNGRPVESYIRLIGTNGSLFADFARGTVVQLPGPGASVISVVFNTYSQSLQNLYKATCSFCGHALKKHRGNHGLSEIIKVFYTSIANHEAFPISVDSTISTISLCEDITRQLREVEKAEEQTALIRLTEDEKKLPSPLTDRGVVLVIGETGMLGRKTAAELRRRGRRVRVLVWKIPQYSNQLPGVEYSSGDLYKKVPEAALSDVTVIVHCAAETIGGKKEHQRNIVKATRNILKGAALKGIKKIIHISSIEVLELDGKSDGLRDEAGLLNTDSLERDPYVGGKAEAERLTLELGGQLGLDIKIIRLGPLIDFSSFRAPGLLGREVGPLFVAFGCRKSKPSLCDTCTAARVIGHYIDKFEEAPSILNLVEPHALTRAELVTMLKKHRPDLKSIWLPMGILKALSRVLAILQRILFPQRQPVNLPSFFSNEGYDTELAAEIIRKSS